MSLFKKKSSEVKLVDDLNKLHKGDKFAKLDDDNLVIDIRKVTKTYTNSNNLIFEILKGVDLQVYEGEFVVILGPSGSGKTTLMNIISGLDRATSGYVNVLGSNLINMSNDELTNFRRMNIGYIFQQYGLIPNLNGKENINIGEYLGSKNKKDLKKNMQEQIKFIESYKEDRIDDYMHLKLSENDIFLSKMDFQDYITYCCYDCYKNCINEVSSIIINKNAYDKFIANLDYYCLTWQNQIKYRYEKEIAKKHVNNIDEVMQSLGIQSLKKKFPNEMSGGQQQRISIARSFVKNPAILFADEPTGAVDLKMNDVILKNFKEINKNYKTTVIIVTHNPDIAKLATKVVHFSDGRIKRIIEQEPQDINVTLTE